MCGQSGSTVTLCNAEPVCEAYQTKLRAALAMPVTSAREKVAKAAALGVLGGLDEYGGFDDLEVHGINTLKKLYPENIKKKVESMKEDDQETDYALAKPLGDATVQFNLGLYYYNDEKPKKAAKWFRRAAMQGHPKAQWNLGCIFKDGKSTVDVKLWFQTAKDNCSEMFVDGEFWEDADEVPDNIDMEEMKIESQKIDIAVDETVKKEEPHLKTCDQCKRDCKKGVLPKRALVNGTWSGPVPKELQDLNDIELSMISMCVAPVLLIVLSQLLYCHSHFFCCSALDNLQIQQHHYSHDARVDPRGSKGW